MCPCYGLKQMWSWWELGTERTGKAYTYRTMAQRTVGRLLTQVCSVLRATQAARPRVLLRLTGKLQGTLTPICRGGCVASISCTFKEGPPWLLIPLFDSRHKEKGVQGYMLSANVRNWAQKLPHSNPAWKDIEGDIPGHIRKHQRNFKSGTLLDSSEN
jgi:hypothetical protein